MSHRAYRFRRLRWLPNAFTIARAIIALVMIHTAVRHQWDVTFVLFVIALLTDFLDGLAAVKLHARSELGEKLDPLADFALSASGLLGLGLAGYAAWSALVAMLLAALLIGYVKFFCQNRPRLQHAVQAFSVAYLFTVWLGLGLIYASLAWRWHWWYAATAGAGLLIAAFMKRHRLLAWYGWLLADRTS